MSARGQLGIRRLEAVEFHVRDLERGRRFDLDRLDCYRPLRLTPEAGGIEDPGYEASFSA